MASASSIWRLHRIEAEHLMPMVKPEAQAGATARAPRTIRGRFRLGRRELAETPKFWEFGDRRLDPGLIMGTMVPTAAPDQARRFEALAARARMELLVKRYRGLSPQDQRLAARGLRGYTAVALNR